MFVPLACSRKILQCEEVLTALFVIETQLEWASFLIMRPFPSPQASPTVAPSRVVLPFLSVGFSADFPQPPACTVEPTAGREGTREEGGVDRALEG